MFTVENLAEAIRFDGVCSGSPDAKTGSRWDSVKTRLLSSRVDCELSAGFPDWHGVVSVLLWAIGAPMQSLNPFELRWCANE